MSAPVPLHPDFDAALLRRLARPSRDPGQTSRIAIVGISKPWEHWTCAHRLTMHEMIMTDSGHFKQIQLAKYGLTGDGTDYEFDYHQTFTLMKVAKVCSP